MRRCQRCGGSILHDYDGSVCINCGCDPDVQVRIDVPVIVKHEQVRLVRPHGRPRKGEVDEFGVRRVEVGSDIREFCSDDSVN